jgi:hypothetical protein
MSRCSATKCCARAYVLRVGDWLYVSEVTAREMMHLRDSRLSADLALEYLADTIIADAEVLCSR